MKSPIIIYFFCCLALTSCVDIIDDLTIHADGSGTFRYSLNLSSSKAKVNSILALDSMDGKPIPSKEEIKQIIDDFRSKLTHKKGISNLEINEDYTNYLFKLSCDFSHVSYLETAIKQSIYELGHVKDDDKLWVSYADQVLFRQIPNSIIQQINNFDKEDPDKLRQGSYTTISRFDTEIKSWENELSQLSKSKKALLLRINMYSLIHDPSLMNNTILLSE